AASPLAPPALADRDTLQAVREALRDSLPAELLDPVAPAATRDPEVLSVLRAAIGGQVERGYGPLRGLPTDEAALLRLFQDALGWGPAQPYLDDERVQEVKIVGDLILVQEEGADFTLAPERFADPGEALDRAMLLATRLNVPLDRARPQDTLPLAHGTRVHVTIPPCTPAGTGLICIRRGRRRPWGLDDVLGRGSCSPAVGDLLRLLVRAGCSFLIAGETGCGKTALLEALVNSWPGEPHVVTIEDNTLEINVRHRAWTRELVQTAVERGAFGRAAREVLRQTPTVVAPGETRAEEAGAILAVAVSGHAVVTTIHARSALRAVQRFADCAAMPGAYMYEGRRDHALEDVCDNFHVVVHLEKVAGRRYIDEVLLLDGVEPAGERLRPRVVRLAWAETSGGELAWASAAQASGDGLDWRGNERTPEGLARRLRLLGLRADVRAAATTRGAADEALARAITATRAGDGQQALAILRRAWADRRDERLVAAAQRALELDAAAAAALAEQSRQAERTIAVALRARRWPQARAAYDTTLADVALVASHTPRGGWEAMADVVAAGEERDGMAREGV
ncbi:MAG TPA: ATPase, T2SS/T4P/T4SS family, partial [Chloroflexaceae bacterium]|nr:ATPase, T2SS/T4P/T4SS family [Chloroflexaceae bacterium]